MAICTLMAKSKSTEKIQRQIFCDLYLRILTIMIIMSVEKDSGLAVNVSQDRQSMIFESYYHQTCTASLDKTLCYKLSVIYQSVCKD